MSRSSTPQKLRSLAANLEKRYPGCRASAEHDTGRRWDFTWRNGPPISQVKKEASTATPEAELRLSRSYSLRAWALAGLRACLDGRVDPYGHGTALDWLVEDDLAQTETPETAAADETRLAAMADRLLGQAGDTRLEHELLAPLTARGASWLLEPRRAKPGTAGPLTLEPAEHLTALYAHGEDARQWQYRLRTLPVEDLLARARADADLDKVGRLAALGLVEQIRLLVANTEAEAFGSARDVDAPGGQASWAEVGAALGISRQAAWERGADRTAGAPTRLSRKP